MKQMYNNSMEFDITNCNKLDPNKNKKKQKGPNSRNLTQRKECYGYGKKNYF